MDRNRRLHRVPLQSPAIGITNQPMPWSTYIVRCRDGSLYVGISTDVAQRIAKHNDGKGAAYTRSHRPVTLVWCEKAASESLARKREAEIKKWTKAKKEELVSTSRPRRRSRTPV
jgi:putative endonuclease